MFLLWSWNQSVPKSWWLAVWFTSFGYCIHDGSHVSAVERNAMLFASQLSAQDLSSRTSSCVHHIVLNAPSFFSFWSWSSWKWKKKMQPQNFGCGCDEVPRRQISSIPCLVHNPVHWKHGCFPCYSGEISWIHPDWAWSFVLHAACHFSCMPFWQWCAQTWNLGRSVRKLPSVLNLY